MTTSGGDDRQYQQALVAAIRSELGGRGWSRKQLAELSGITEQTMERIFNLKRDMSVRQVEQIAAALGVEPESLALEARRWRAGTSTGRLSTGIPASDYATWGSTHLPTDPRSLLRSLIDNPDMDDELTHRLEQAA